MYYSHLYMLLKGIRAIIVCPGASYSLSSSPIPYLTPENSPIKVHHQQNPCALKLFSEITFLLLNTNLDMPWKHGFTEAQPPRPPPPQQLYFFAPKLRGCNWSLCPSLQPWTFIPLQSSLKTLSLKPLVIRLDHPLTHHCHRHLPSLGFLPHFSVIFTPGSLPRRSFQQYFSPLSCGFQCLHTQSFCYSWLLSSLFSHYLSLTSHAYSLEYSITKYCMLPFSRLHACHSLTTLLCLALELIPSKVQTSNPSEPTIH